MNIDIRYLGLVVLCLALLVLIFINIDVFLIGGLSAGTLALCITIIPMFEVSLAIYSICKDH